MKTNQYLIIMAGGVGTRLWPFSRANYPKQFHDLLDKGKTMLQETIDRFKNICPNQNIFVVTNEDYENIIKEQLPQIPEENILLEPIKRNTAPCIAYAAYKIYQKNKEANLVVVPSDQHINQVEKFVETIQQGLNFTAKNNALVTLGIKPTRPDTGYGYIQFEEDKKSNISKVKHFLEKPDLESAKAFIKSGDFVWNAGIFIWKVTDIIEAFQLYLPELANYFKEIESAFYTDKERQAIKDIYTQMRKNVSIDVGIMEKAENVYVILSDFDWSDVGTWKSLYEESQKDKEGNVISGQVQVYNSKNCIIKTPKNKLVVINGLDNFIVAEFDDVLLISKKEDEQRVRDFVEDAKLNNEKYI
jgi:mannose-1-phosphate guanylyltransferase